MHDPANACAELTRCVKEYSMVGAMINDFQTGSDGKPIFYDGPEFDVFWKTVQELDVVVYIHPRFPHPEVIENLFGGRRALLGACWYCSHFLLIWVCLMRVGVLLLGLGLMSLGFVQMASSIDFQMLK
jgi:hypothetical protein